MWHRLQENTEIRTRLSDFTDSVFEHNFLVLQYLLLTVSCVAIVVGSYWPFKRLARMKCDYNLGHIREFLRCMCISSALVILRYSYIM